MTGEAITERERRSDGRGENEDDDDNPRFHGSLLKCSATHSGLRLPAMRASSARAAISA